MKRNLSGLTIASLALLSATIAHASTAAPLANRLVIPAAAHTEGAAGSKWATDLDLWNGSSAEVTIRTTFVAEGSIGTDASPSANLTIPAHGSLAVTDALATLFPAGAASGALSFDLTDAQSRKVALTSRTYNLTANGSFGQTIPALGADSALSSGQTGILFPPRDPATSRMNFGSYALEDSVANWRVLSSDGTVVAERLGIAYAKSSVARYNDGIRSFLSATAAAGQVVEVEVVSGRLLPWASRIDNQTNDGDFSIARPVHDNDLPVILGLDTNGDGQPEIRDADTNGTLDLSLAVSNSAAFPYDVRLLATDPEGHALSFTGVSLPSTVLLDAGNGRLTIFPSQGLGLVGSLKVRVSDGTDSVLVTIPISSY